MKRKVLSMILSIAIVFEMGSFTIRAHSEKNISGADILRQICEGNEESVVCNAYENSMETQAYMKSIYLQDVMEVSKEHLECYGGTYISDDNELVVLLTDTVNSTKEYCEELVGEGVVYKQCAASIEELTELYDYIINLWTESDEFNDENFLRLKDDIVGVGIYVEQNKVYVRIKNCDSEKIALFKECILDSEDVIFEEGEEYEESAGYILKPGEGIYVGAPSSVFGSIYSIGFRCKRLNSYGVYTYGFITAAHGNEISDSVYSATGEWIGYIMSRSYVDGGNVDAAYVNIINSKYSCSIHISNCSACLSPGYYVVGYATGSTAYKSGIKTGHTYGKIISTSATEKMDTGYTIKDLVIAEYTSFFGDSGGIVYMIIDGKTCVAGITVACSGKKSAFVKVANIKKVLNIIFY
ncbi:MAG: hypothetical protein IJP13_04295 [Lachnospiraceae bacterium]|nr:hypothetical protein [Lachnospiraceae bacterium]